MVLGFELIYDKKVCGMPSGRYLYSVQVNEGGHVKEILDKGRYYWVSSNPAIGTVTVLVKRISMPTAVKWSKFTNGFNHCEWIVKELLNYGRIRDEWERKLEQSKTGGIR